VWPHEKKISTVIRKCERIFKHSVRIYYLLPDREVWFRASPSLATAFKNTRCEESPWHGGEGGYISIERESKRTRRFQLFKSAFDRIARFNQPVLRPNIDILPLFPHKHLSDLLNYIE
jgi:hypothetical protein